MKNGIPFERDDSKKAVWHTDISYEEACKLFESDFWDDKTNLEKVAFQLYENHLAMKFPEFHKAVEAVLDRPIWSHQFIHVRDIQEVFEELHPEDFSEFRNKAILAAKEKI